MRARFSILLALSMLMLLALVTFDPSQETYVGMQIQTIAGKPYLLLAEMETFGIFTPSGKNIESWTPAYINRSGTLYGSFEIPRKFKPSDALPIDPKISAPSKTESKEPDVENRITVPIEGLGVFFDQSCAAFDVDTKDKENGVVPFSMELTWSPETASSIKGETIAFGAKPDPSATESELPTGVLKAARFDGKTWVEMPGVTGPQVRSGKAGFWLKSVALDERVAILWRGAKRDQTIDAIIEGPRIATDGDVGLCYFDGTKFSDTAISVTGLPKGNMCVWAEKNTIKCLVQTRVKGNEEPNSKGRMEIWTVAPDGKATLSETIAASHNSTGLFSNIAAEHFTWENHEYILRSNWQRFELWRRNDSGAWEVVPTGTAGLPEFTLERKLIGALIICAFVVLIGAVLGFMRRRHAATLLRKLRARDLNAPLAPRAGAYLLDMLVVIGVSIGVSQLCFDQYVDIIATPLSNVAIPSTTLLICFMLYFALSEWLFGATPGKFLMGLRVVSDGGKRPTFWAALVRNAVGLIERQPVMMLVSFPMVVFSPQRQRLGDLLSRTIVVQKHGLDIFLAQRAAAVLKGETIDKLPSEVLEEEKKDAK